MQGTVGDKRLFWACFFALTATSFAFILRIMILKDLAQEFGLSETQKGEILGVGIWPFAVSIVLFSLVIDRIGYGKAIVFAFLGHTAFAVLTIFAKRATGVCTRVASWAAWRRDVPHPDADDDPSRHHRARDRQLDHRARGTGNGSAGWQLRMGPGLHHGHHAGLAVHGRSDRAQAVASGPADFRAKGGYKPVDLAAEVAAPSAEY